MAEGISESRADGALSGRLLRVAMLRQRFFTYFKMALDNLIQQMSIWLSASTSERKVSLSFYDSLVFLLGTVSTGKELEMCLPD